MSFKKISSLENCRFRFKKIQTQQEQKPFFSNITEPYNQPSTMEDKHTCSG